MLKTSMDLLQEYCLLNEARIELGGRMEPSWESRWRELNRFYQRLMAARPLPRQVAFDASEIRRRLKHRGRLRVRAEMDGFFEYRGKHHPSRAINLSRGGLFLSTRVTLPVGTRVTLYLPNLAGRYETLFETDVEVTWVTRGGSRRLPQGMGLRFVSRPVVAELDSFIVESIRERLSRASVAALAPELARPEVFSA